MKNSFFKNFLLYFTGSMVVSIINYAFYPIVGRLLSVSEFGEMQVLIALVTQVGLMLAALATVITHTTAATQSQAEARKTVAKLRSVIMLIGVPLLLLSMFTIPLLQSYLHYDAWLPFISLFVGVFVSLTATFNNAVLQGQKKFTNVSYMNILQAGSKLLITIALIYLGFGVLGAMLGILASGIIGYAYTTHLIGKWHAPRFKNISAYRQAVTELLPELRYGLLSLITLASMAVLFTIDVIAVKHYFNAQTAGVYAGISTIAKIAYFVLTPLSAVLLPSISSEGSDVRKRRHIVKTATIVLSTMSITGLTIVYFMHNLITSLLFGERFAHMSYLLPSLTLAMVLLAILYTIVMYGLALRAKVLAYFLPLGALTTVVLNTLHHATLEAIISNLIIGTLVPIILLGIMYLHSLYKSLVLESNG